MRIIVLSDSHRFLEYAEDVINMFYKDIKTVIHLGDMESDYRTLVKKYGSIEFYGVLGNNDRNSSMPYEKMIEIEGKRLLLTHGHRQRVSYGLLSLALWAKEKESDVVLFGHTHVPVKDHFDELLICKPGSISLPRATNNPTFGILELGEKTDFKVFEYLGKGNIREMGGF